MRLATLALALLFASPAGAQAFRPLGGPWTRDHTLVGSTPDGRIFATSGTRLGVTTDGSRTWTVVSETVAPVHIAADGDALIGAFPDGVRRSTDGGATWTPWGLDGLSVLNVAVDGSAYAVTYDDAFKREPGGEWAPLPNQLSDPSAGGTLYNVAAAGGTVALAGAVRVCDGSPSNVVLLRSRDGGQSWTRTVASSVPTGLAVSPTGTVFLSARDDYYVCVGFSYRGGIYRQGVGETALTRLATGSFGAVAVDGSGGPVWSVGDPSLAAPPYIEDVAALEGVTVAGSGTQFASDYPYPTRTYVPQSGLYAANGEGAVQVGFEPSAIRTMAIIRDTLAVAADGAIFRLDTDGWKSWAGIQSGRAFVDVPWTPGRSIVVSPFNFGLGAFDDPPGAAWVGEPVSGDGRGAPLAEFTSVAAVSTGVAVVSSSRSAYGPTGIYRSVEAGYVVEAEYCDIGSLGHIETTLYAGAVTGIWPSCSSGPPPARILRSDDGGSTWVPDDEGITAQNVYVFTLMGTGPTRVDLAGTSAGVFARSPGQPWQLDGLPRTVYTLVHTPAGLLAGTTNGLFARDTGGSWAPFGSGLTGLRAYSILSTDDAYGPWLGVGTDAGVFATRPFGVGAEAPAPVSGGPLAVTTLPNPARGARTVHVDWLGAEAASVAVFDLLGRRVADLGTHEPTADGRLDVAWDAAGLPAGVYVVRVQSGGETAAVRAVVTR